MRFTTRLFLTWVTIFLCFYLGIILMVALLWNVELSFFKLFLVFLVVGVLPPALITSYFYKKLNFVESEDINEPNFPHQRKIILSFRQMSLKQRPFDELMVRVDRQWVLMFTDRENQILKFRTDTRIFSWGVGVYLKMIDSKTVNVIVYPIMPMTKHDVRVINHTLRLLQSVLNP